MSRLAGKVAIVTGASRGVGRGVAQGLCEAGARVWLSGRSETDLAAAAADCAALGGEAHGVVCDHSDDSQVEGLFADVERRAGRLDVLVNSAWGGYENMLENGRFSWPDPFWEQPRWRWDAMFGAGVRAAYVASAWAARVMVPAGSGLIVHVSSLAAQQYIDNVAYGVAKAATDRLARDMAHELAPHGVSCVSLYPGLVRTEKVMANAEHMDLSNSESPRFSGRAVAALAADPEVGRKSGQVCVAALLGIEYGFTDVDGSQPRPLTLEEA